MSKLPSKIKHRFQEFLASPKTFFVLASAVLVALAVPLSKNVVQRYGINREIQDLQTEIEQTQHKNTELEQLITYLQSDQFVEEQARLNLGLKKDGEQVIVVKGGDEPAQPAQSDQPVFTIPGLEKSAGKQAVSNPVRWRNYFLK